MNGWEPDICYAKSGGATRFGRVAWDQHMFIFSLGVKLKKREDAEGDSSRIWEHSPGGKLTYSASKSDLFVCSVILRVYKIRVYRYR